MATHTRVNQDSKEKWAMDVNVANPIEVEVSDIQIGAVELKDSTTDARAPISSTDGLLVNLGTNNDVVVSATNLDIRALSDLTDSVEVTQGTAADLKCTAIIDDSTPPKVDCNSSNVTVSGTATTTPVSQSSVVLTDDGQVKASAGSVYAVLVSGVGVTAGDKVELKNSTDNTGDALLTIVADSANGTWAFNPCVGVSFGTGIYCDETKSGGTFTVTVVYA